MWEFKSSTDLYEFKKASLLSIIRFRLTHITTILDKIHPYILDFLPQLVPFRHTFF
jgi:hypothetical protein